MCVVAHVGRRQRLQKLTRTRTHQRDNPRAGGHVGQHAVRIGWNVFLQPVKIANLRFRGRDDQEGIFGKPGYRQVRFDASSVVQPLRVDKPSDIAVDIVGTDVVQDTHGVATLQPEFGEGRLVEQADTLTHGHVLGGRIVEPVLPSPAVFVCGRHARRRIPVGALPAERLAVTGADGAETFVKRRSANTARCFVLPEWPVRRIQQAQALADPFLQILAIALERHVAPHVHFPQVDRRMTVADPLGHDFADAAGGLQADGVQPGSDETIAELGRLADVIAHVRGKALGSAEKLLHAGLLEGRHALHGILQNGLEVLETAGDFVEAKIVRNAVHTPGPRGWLECADQELAGVILIISAGVVIAQHRQVGFEACNRFEQCVIMLAGM